MIKIAKNISLYISAFVPMYVLVLVKLVVEMCNHNLSFNVLNSINMITLLMLIAFGSFGLWWNMRVPNDKVIEVEIKSVKNITDQHFLGYFSLFVFFAIPLDLSYVSSYCVYLLVLVLIGVVYINSSLYYINPLLNILGYNFYDIVYVRVGKGGEESAKIFYKGDKLRSGQRCKIMLQNQHFCFLRKQTLEK